MSLYRLLEKNSPIKNIRIARRGDRFEAEIFEPLRYMERDYGDEDMVEYFAFKLLLKLRGSNTQNPLSREIILFMKEKIYEIQSRLFLKNLLNTSENRTINTEFAEMLRLGLMKTEEQKGLEITNNILGKSAYIEMQETLKDLSYEKCLQECTSFVNEWDWGCEIE